jgi:hypothetical protein
MKKPRSLTECDISVYYLRFPSFNEGRVVLHRRAQHMKQAHDQCAPLHHAPARKGHGIGYRTLPKLRIMSVHS